MAQPALHGVPLGLRHHPRVGLTGGEVSGGASPPTYYVWRPNKGPMTLLDVKKLFIHLSGRYDLVQDTTTYVDAVPIGATFFIEAGQRFLDRAAGDFVQKHTEWRSTVVAGSYAINSAAVRSIRNVRVETTDGTYYLVKCGYRELIELFGDKTDFATIEAGVPAYYSIVSIRSLSAPDTATEGNIGILMLPPLDADYDIIVEGTFRSNVLAVDGDESFWTIKYPETLVHAAWYELERFYRNTQGMEDHLAAIQRDLQNIDFDVVEQDISRKNQMRNAW